MEKTRRAIRRPIDADVEGSGGTVDRSAANVEALQADNFHLDTMGEHNGANVAPLAPLGELTFKKENEKER